MESGESRSRMGKQRQITGSILGLPQNENKTKQEETGSKAKADQARSTEKELCGVWTLGPLLFFSSLLG